MVRVLRSYVNGDFQVTEYTRDGETVSHVLTVPVQSETPRGEVLPVPPTFEQRFEAMQVENLELKLALAEMAEKSAEERLETQLALAELAELLTGGAK